MSSAAFSVPNGSQPKISVSRRGQSPTTATSAAANDAIQQILDARRRRHKYGQEPEIRQSALGGAVEEAVELVRGSVSRLGVVRWTVAAIVLTAVGGTLLAAALQARSAPRHSVAGTALINGKPLGRVTLVFHAQHGEAQAEPFSQSVFTADDGTFQIVPSVGIPAGSYAVVVQGGASALRGTARKTTSVPPKYRDPSTTPLRVEIAGDATGLQVVVQSR